MKKILLTLFIAICSLSASAQNNDKLVSFDGIGAFKYGISKSAIEKLVGTKIVLKHIGIDEVYTEGVDVKYKGSDMKLSLMRADAMVAYLDGIETSDPSFKTAEGIGVGADQLTIINTYEKHLLIITSDRITLADINNLHASIVFTMNNKKVTAIGVEPTAAFRDRE